MLIYNNRIIMNDIKYKTDVAVTVAGSVDSGKSSFIGVISTGILDDGNGKARASVAKHQHEINTGQTSDISTRTIIIPETKKALTLVDLCGHEKYLKTTTSGIAGYFPDYGILIVAANRGILPMSKQHVTLMMSNNIPIVIFVTRADITPEEQYDKALDDITKYFEKEWKTKVEFMNKFFDPSHNTPEFKKTVLEKISTNMKMIKARQKIIPVLSISNKTGFYIDISKQFLGTLEPRQFWDNFDVETTDEFDNSGKDATIPAEIIPKESRCNNRIIATFMNKMDKKFFPPLMQTLDKSKDEYMFYIDTAYQVDGSGLVVSGINRNSIIKVGDEVFLGPFLKEFKEIRLRSMHNNVRQVISSMDHHDRGCIAIAGIRKTGTLSKDMIKRGMIITNSKKVMDNICYRFNAVITILNHPSTLKTNYCPTLHMGTIRQPVRMTLLPENNDGKDSLKSREFGYVTFKFRMGSEYVEPYTIFIFRSGGIHGLGVVTSIVPLDKDDDARPDPIRYKRRFKHKRGNDAKPQIKPVIVK